MDWNEIETNEWYECLNNPLTTLSSYSQNELLSKCDVKNNAFFVRFICLYDHIIKMEIYIYKNNILQKELCRATNNYLLIDAKKTICITPAFLIKLQTNPFDRYKELLNDLNNCVFNNLKTGVWYKITNTNDIYFKLINIDDNNIVEYSLCENNNKYKKILRKPIKQKYINKRRYDYKFEYILNYTNFYNGFITPFQLQETIEIF
tara:strand:+ start:155 stop:769 length:615 start_codon:yes stop_codon:yes gene_type:complete